MREIAKLQNMLVEEALQNTRIQRTFLYFSALSAALALFALNVPIKSGLRTRQRGLRLPAN